MRGCGEGGGGSRTESKSRRVAESNMAGYLTFKFNSCDVDYKVQVDTSRHFRCEISKLMRVRQEQDNFLVGSQEPFLATVKRRKLAWFGHVTRHDNLLKTILQGTLAGGRHCGRQRKCWMDNIREWPCLPMPELLTRASCRKDWKRVSAESFFMTPLMTRSVKGLK